MPKLKISVGDLVNYKLTRGEWIPGLPSNAKGYQTAVVASICQPTTDTGKTDTLVSLRGGPDAKHGGTVYYHRSRFEVVQKGYETHNPHSGERQVPETNPVVEAVENQGDTVDGARAANKAADDMIRDAQQGVVSKRDAAVAIYAWSGGVRRTGMSRLTLELGLSKAAASTYWQNVKSGKWS